MIFAPFVWFYAPFAGEIFDNILRGEKVYVTVYVQNNLSYRCIFKGNQGALKIICLIRDPNHSKFDLYIEYHYFIEKIIKICTFFKLMFPKNYKT